MLAPGNVVPWGYRRPQVDPLRVAYLNGDLPGLTAELLAMARDYLTGANEVELNAATLTTLFSMPACPTAGQAREYARRIMLEWILTSKEPDEQEQASN